MSKYCLVSEAAEKFKQMLKSGKIDPEKLAGMTSAQRREFFGGFLSETDAKNVNALLERKLLQKNKWNAVIRWAEQVTGIKPELRNDLVSRIQRMADDPKGSILDPAKEEAFLQDLASARLGLDVSLEEAQEITRRSRAITKAQEAAGDFTDDATRIAYGEKIIEMNEYLATLKPPMHIQDQIANVANVPRAIMATADMSAPGRQGWGMVSRKEFWKNLGPMVKAFSSEKYYKQVQSDIITRPNYRSMKRAGLRLTDLGDKLTEREEAFMTNLLDKIPAVRPSERAYTAFLSKLRADVYDDILRKMELMGEDISMGSEATKDLANMVNNFTGAGSITKTGQSVPFLNSMFFSPRKIAATFQMFNPQKYFDPRISPTVRKESIRNLFGMVGATVSILSLARMAGAEVETDPRSSDFGKFKVNNTRIDVSGGNASWLTFLSRLMTNKTKSTVTGLVREFGGGWGTTTRGDIIVKYFRNKLSPIASYFGDMYFEEDFKGDPFDPKKAALNRLQPIIISSTIETMMEGDTQGAMLTAAADFLGFGGSTYGAGDNWNNKDSIEMKELKSRFGQEKFDELNDEFNERYDKLLTALEKDEKYIGLPSDEERAAVIKKRKDALKKDILSRTPKGSLWEKYDIQSKITNKGNLQKLFDMPEPDRMTIIRSYPNDIQRKIIQGVKELKSK